MEFSTYSIKEGSTVNTYGQFVVKDVAWDAQCGGEDLERALIDHLAAEFKAKHGTDVRTVPRALAKLRKQVCVLCQYVCRIIDACHRSSGSRRCCPPTQKPP